MSVAAGRLETAVRHSTLNVPQAAPTIRSGEVVRGLAGRRFDSVADLAVVEDGRLVGLVSIEHLLAADPDVPVGALMDSDPPAVAPGADQEQAALQMARRGRSSLAVVDEERRFHGLIPPGRMLAVLLAEHEEDLARLGGFMAGTSEARSAAEEDVAQRLWHRLPWLLVGLAGAMGTAAIVGSFEAELRRVLLLSFFIPAVVYMADAVGTQTEALVIRGIAVGVPVGRILGRELATGGITGLVIAVGFLPFAYGVWGDGRVALTVAIALFASCSTAALVGMGLPYLLHRLGHDPAFGSGPLGTVIQDLLSILIYFGVALLLV